MNTKDKLDLMKEIERRNAERLREAGLRQQAKAREEHEGRELKCS